MIDLIQKILKIFEENGLWGEGVELIGSWCFQLYQKHLGVKSFPLRTVDIDFLVPSPYKGKEKIDLIRLLEPLGFKLGFNSDGSVYLWGPELKIEFLTAERGRGQTKAKEIKNLAIKATPLRFVDMLFEDPIKVNEQGVEVLIPNPICFALHKLLISARRKNQEKKRKDLEQAIFTLESCDVGQVAGYYKGLPKPWRKTIQQTLEAAQRSLPLQEKFIAQLLITLQSIK